MTLPRNAAWMIVVSILAVLSGPLATAARAQSSAELNQLMQKYKDGNYAEAFEGLERWVLNPTTDEPRMDEALETAIDCLVHLNRVSEIDAFRERVAAADPRSWHALAAVARSYMRVTHHGFLIAGQFQRGDHRGGGQVANAAARDRARALQLYRQAVEQLEDEIDKRAAASLLRDFAAALVYGHDSSQAWQLQMLTDLDVLPDYEEGWGRAGAPRGAPVDVDGNPIFYGLPTNWEAAQNDGQRWRWVLELMVTWDPSLRSEEQTTRAQFLLGQFGVQTLQEFEIWFARQSESMERSGRWALDTLGEDETIARLANGIKRFSLPDDQNHIKLFQQATQTAEIRGSSGNAVDLARIFANRRQYDRAAEYWQIAIEHSSGTTQENLRDQLAQIIDNWGQFEPILTQPAGRGATVDFRFRNGSRVEFTAHRVRVRQLLADVKTYLKNASGQLDWNQVQIENLGYRLVTEQQDRYLGEEAARWSLELEPRDKHFDRRITVTTPLEKAGAYLLTATMSGGNTSKIIVWLADTVIVQKPLANRALYFVADAVTGEPIAKANVEFFGYWQQHVDANRYRLYTQQLANVTNEQGQVYLPAAKDDPHRNMQWLATATTPNGRFAYLGYSGVWANPYRDQPYNAIKVFAITDRPVYRPKQPVEFKFWIRRARYDHEDTSEFAHQSFQVEIHDPKGEKVYSDTVAADEYGGVTGTFDLGEGAALGQYRLQLVNHGGGTFRVEEYKKPEFEVAVDAPVEPVQLGEVIQVKICAQYYFGSPVTRAKVKYKVLRTEQGGHWFPPGRWDWLYGPGYWWFAYDYDWYPGWQHWGCARPAPWWFWRRPTPPEVVLEQESDIGPDGTVEITIDTSLAKEFHPDQDHSYQIQAEVVDESRRTIVATGRVLVAREPFKVFVWMNRGYYRVGDTVQASVAARRLDGEPVQGAGTLKLLKLSYEQGDNDLQPEETEVRSWDLATDAAGRADLQINASEAGQYRLSYSLTDASGHAFEGAYVFTITGEGFDGSAFRFDDLELIPDRQEYAPGDTVRLQLNTNRTGSTVLLFARPAGGVYLPPQVVRLDGKSTTVDLEVDRRDMPNFFVEAVTISQGRIHNEIREIYVPPERRILNVEVVPSAEAYEPGQHAELKLKLTDHAGEPFVGSTVLAMYDKSVEYISGGSNVADIKEFFWKWRRQHRPQSQSNLDQWSMNVVPPGGKEMHSIGIFGETVADDLVVTKEERADAGIHTWSAMPRHRGRQDLRMSRQMEAAALPASASVAESGDALSFGADRFALADADGGAAQLAEPTIRSEFADTAIWVAALRTGSDGLASVELDMPENLTTWKVRVWAMGSGTRVGEGSAEVVTRKNLLVRMQAPRFFVEQDEVVLSANVHNYLPAAKQVQVRLELEGKSLEAPSVMQDVVEIEAGGEKRIDWRVRVQQEGEAAVRMLALTDEESDAVEMRFPVFVHGMSKIQAYSGVIRSDELAGAFEVTVPEKRRAADTRLEVRYSPTLAGAMVDALPYLIDYPHGCTEQTLNRFLPAVIVQQTLIRRGLDMESIREKRTNLNAQEFGDDRQRAADWQRYERNPVFDAAELAKIVKAGVSRLTEMQLADGGWGWFSGWGEQSTPHTTSVVVHGLQIAQQNDVALVPGVLERGVDWLKDYQARQLELLRNVDQDGKVIDEHKPSKQHVDNLDALVYLVLVDADSPNDRMRDYLYRDRTNLSVYGLAMVGLALHKQADAEKLAMVMRNISQYLVEDDENQTAYLNLPGGHWWYWYGSEYEAHAFYLKLLAATEPESEVASRIVKYLLNNRKHSTYWNSTRDTALVVEALADFLEASGEAEPELTVEVWIGGQKRKEVAINADNLFSFDNKFVLTGTALEPGRTTVELRKRGRGPLYYNGYLSNFTLEDDIRRAGLELKVNRRYYKLVPADKSVAVAGSRGEVVKQAVEKYDRQALTNLASIQSGDLVEIELVVESKNDYEYVVLEDKKAAGFEPVALRSGYSGNSLGAYMELRDDRVNLFVRKLARGTHSLSYRMRAEIPGRFSALPTKAYAMYAPELMANSDEIKLRIEE